MYLSVSILLVSIILVFLIKWISKRLNYFKYKNIPYLQGFPFIGVLTDIVTGKKGIYDCIKDAYNNPKFKNERFFGVFLFHKPALLIKDPEIIKQILIKDFNSFVNHVAGTDEHDKIGMYHPFIAKGELWKNLRRKTTPFFSSGKLKAMFPVFDEIGDNLIEHIERIPSNGTSTEINLKDKILPFTTDVICRCVFGVDARALQDPASEFVTIGGLLFEFNFHRALEFSAIFMLPEIAKICNFKMFTEKGTEFLKRAITDVMEEREKSKVKRNDLVDIFIDIKNSGMKDDDGNPITMDMLIGTACGLFFGGQETSPTSASFTLYQIAKHQEIQDRVRSEILDGLVKNDGKLTYDMVMNETPYLHQVMQETLRLYPIVPHLDRECSNPNGYSMKPYSDLVVPYKMPILIPIYGIQRDEKYFPDPLKFDPERFSPENIQKIPSNTYLPFGTGNRICIGERFGIMQTKMAIIKILMSYRVDVTDQTPEEIRLSKLTFTIHSEKPLILKLVKDKLEV